MLLPTWCLLLSIALLRICFSQYLLPSLKRLHCILLPLLFRLLDTQTLLINRRRVNPTTFSLVVTPLTSFPALVFLTVHLTNLLMVHHNNHLTVNFTKLPMVHSTKLPMVPHNNPLTVHSTKLLTANSSSPLMVNSTSLLTANISNPLMDYLTKLLTVHLIPFLILHLTTVQLTRFLTPLLTLVVTVLLTSSLMVLSTNLLTAKCKHHNTLLFIKISTGLPDLLNGPLLDIILTLCSNNLQITIFANFNFMTPWMRMIPKLCLFI